MKALRYLSVCSGIEAATAAWKPLGWKAVAFAEVEKFPSAVLAHHYPDVPNLGDMTKIDGEQYRGAVDLIVGGTPCQDFSIAGKRAGMAGERGGLALAFVELVSAVSPRWLVWENVPGVLSSGGGNDFADFLLALRECGYHVGYRVLNAQYFGVPQRRRRVFVVGYFGDWRPAAAVLFEPSCLRRDTPPSRQTKAEVAGGLEASAGRSRGAGINPGTALSAHSVRMDFDTETEDGTGRQNLVVVPPLTGNPYGDHESREGLLVLKAFHGSQDPGVSAVRRLTPLEFERLMGFPDGYTDIPGASDSARYKALGNSMVVDVMRWIGERICMCSSKLALLHPLRGQRTPVGHDG